MRHAFSTTRKTRVIVNTDAKNEADDQFAIVHALLTPSFEIAGLIPAHFGIREGRNPMAESRTEIELLLDLMEWGRPYQIADGAAVPMSDPQTPVTSPGSDLIVREAMMDDPRPLHVLFFGPLTDMAAALLTAPQIARRNVRVIWIGGGPYPGGGSEFNLMNDVHAANVVLASGVEIWQVPSSTYRITSVSYAEMVAKVAPCGKIGRYLFEQCVAFNEADPWANGTEHRPLGDSPAVGLAIYPECGRTIQRPRPRFLPDGRYTEGSPDDPPIRVVDSIDTRFLFEDMFAKLKLFAEGVHWPPA